MLGSSIPGDPKFFVDVVFSSGTPLRLMMFRAFAANSRSIFSPTACTGCVQQSCIARTSFANVWLLQFFASAIQIRIGN
jgi:hypothetical protein